MSVPSNDLTVPAVALPATDPGRARVLPRWSLVLPPVLVSLGGGLVVGAIWAVTAPLVAGSTSELEDAAARDTTFGLLGVLAGLVTAVVLLVWPSSHPALHTGVVLAAVTGASLLAWGVGRALGAHPLHAVALVVVWPLVASAVTVVRSLISVLFGPD